MKKPDPDRLMRLANAIFPDTAELALYNTYIEIVTGALIAETLEGPEDVADDPDAELVAVLAFATVGSETCRLRWAFSAVSDDQRTELDRVALDNSVLLEEGYKVSIPSLPRCAAALAAVRAPDGRHAYVLHRHPHVTRKEALGIITKMAEPPPTPPTPSGDPN